MPPELQREVQAEVEQTKRRSGWPARRTLAALGVSPARYYRWRKEASGAGVAGEPVRPVQPYEATAEEKRSGVGLCPETSGASASRAGLADGGRGRGVPEPVDGVPDFEGGEPGVSVEATEEADPGRGGEGDAAEREVGDAT